MASKSDLRRRRSPLESLESRMVPASMLRPRAALVELMRTPRVIPGNFTGRLTGVTSSSFRIAGLSGKLGLVSFNGGGSGTYSGLQFTGGTFTVRNRRGSMVASLDAARIRAIAGNRLTFTANAEIGSSTGRYDPVEGSTGRVIVSFARTLRGNVQVRFQLTRFTSEAATELGYF
jgi:hypothetical protein